MFTTFVLIFCLLFPPATVLLVSFDLNSSFPTIVTSKLKRRKILVAPLFLALIIRNTSVYLLGRVVFCLYMQRKW